jgi:branched-subunit amino acid transport protein AzlD
MEEARMYLTPFETFVTILAVALGAIITRFVPFLLFPENKEQHPVVTYLGQMLPPAMLGLLVVYSLKNVDLLAPAHGMAELISIIFIIAIHLWKRNVLLSIGLGTALYMFLIQVVFQ